MNEDLSACWTRFCLEEFPVRRFLCELFWVECCVHVISAAVYWYLPAYWVFLILLNFCSMSMSMILQKCYLFCLKILIAFCLPLSCFIFMLFFFLSPLLATLFWPFPTTKQNLFKTFLMQVLLYGSYNQQHATDKYLQSSLACILLLCLDWKSSPFQSVLVITSETETGQVIKGRFIQYIGMDKTSCFMD